MLRGRQRDSDWASLKKGRIFFGPEPILRRQRPPASSSGQSLEEMTLSGCGGRKPGLVLKCLKAAVPSAIPLVAKCYASFSSTLHASRVRAGAPHTWDTSMDSAGYREKRERISDYAET